MKKHELVIQHELCWGCRTCEVACKQEFNVPPGIQLLRLGERGPENVDGKLEFSFTINLCRHCDEPPCAGVCPANVITKREDGIVVLDHKSCTGCRSCVDACPYTAIEFDETNGAARKCNLCHNRVDKGLLPACADNVCLGHCIHFSESGKIVTKTPST